MNISIDISNVTLHTDRLVLRPWILTDTDDLFEYAKVEGVGIMAGWPAHKNIEASRSIVKMFIEGKKTFAIEYKGKVIGSLGIEEYNEKLFPELDNLKGRELGFVLSKDYWGQGMIVEACKEVIKWLFETVGCEFIMCGHFEENRQSARVQEKLGFKEYGRATYITFTKEEKQSVYNIMYKENC